MYGRHVLFQIEQLREGFQVADGLRTCLIQLYPVNIIIKTDEARLIVCVYAG